MPKALAGVKGSNLAQDKRYDQILHLPSFSGAFTGKGGVVDFYAGDHAALYRGMGGRVAGMTKEAFTYELSDHLPLWVQVGTDDDRERRASPNALGCTGPEAAKYSGRMNDHENDLTRQVYARFGLAYYLGECVHRGLVNAYAMLPLGPGRVTLPRVHERTRAAEAMTLGTLVTAALPILPKELHSSLSATVERRNYLAHGFWWDRFTQMGSMEGKKMLVQELIGVTDQFGDLSQTLDNVVDDHLRSVGITDEQFSAAGSEAASAPLPTIPNRPSPKTGETIEIVDAWIAETLAGRGSIQLRDVSGMMWQVGELGLEWSYQTPMDHWRRFKPLAAKLPAQVVARPKNAKPWKYKIHVSTGVLLSVTWDADRKLPV